MKRHLIAWKLRPCGSQWSILGSSPWSRAPTRECPAGSYVLRCQRVLRSSLQLDWDVYSSPSFVFLILTPLQQEKRTSCNKSCAHKMVNLTFLTMWLFRCIARIICRTRPPSCIWSRPQDKRGRELTPWPPPLPRLTTDPSKTLLPWRTCRSQRNGNNSEGVHRQLPH